MPRWLVWTLILTGLLAAAVFVAWRSVLSEAPHVSPAFTLSQADLERGRQIYRQIFPFLAPSGSVRQLRLTARDIDLGLNYLLARRQLGHARTHLGPGQIEVDLSLRVPALARYLNLQLELAPVEGRLDLTRAYVGGLPVPGPIARSVLSHVLGAGQIGGQLHLLDDIVREARLTPDEVHLTLAWDAQRVRAVLDTAGQQLAGVQPEQLDAYRDRLAALARQRPAPEFAQVMGELFALAQQRSRAHDAVTENRALLIALAEAANGRRLGLPKGAVPRLGEMNLAGRRDYVQHFTLSAALAAVGGEDLADFAGLYKEVRDTHGGSGFSFSDLAADRAGSHFGMRVTASEASARRVQRLLAGSRETSLYIPEISDLPEFLPLAEFQRRYGGIGGEGYARVVERIERRIAALPVHRMETE